MRLTPRNKKRIVGTHRSLLQLFETSRLVSSNQISAIFETNAYQPLFIKASAAQVTSLDTNKWRIWAQKQAFRGIASHSSFNDSTNVVPLTKPQRFTSDNYFAQELLDKLDKYESTEKAPQLRFTPNPEFVQRHTFVPGMSKQRKGEPLYNHPHQDLVVCKYAVRARQGSM